MQAVRAAVQLLRCRIVAAALPRVAASISAAADVRPPKPAALCTCRPARSVRRLLLLLLPPLRVRRSLLQLVPPQASDKPAWLQRRRRAAQRGVIMHPKLRRSSPARLLMANQAQRDHANKHCTPMQRAQAHERQCNAHLYNDHG